jgi:hypothetical protein
MAIPKMHRPATLTQYKSVRTSVPQEVLVAGVPPGHLELLPADSVFDHVAIRSSRKTEGDAIETFQPDTELREILPNADAREYTSPGEMTEGDVIRHVTIDTLMMTSLVTHVHNDVC